jgi:hypothetical protein
MLRRSGRANDLTVASSDTEAVPERDARGGGAKRDELLPIGERQAWCLGFAVAIPAAVIGGFVVAIWESGWFREYVGVLAPYVAGLLYVTVGVLIVVSVPLRRLRARFRFSSVEMLGGPLALCGAVLVYLVALAGKWEKGDRGGYSAIAGVIPWSDADGYFTGAQRLLFEGHLDDWNSRRPLNGAFLADRLALTNLDLRLALVIQATLLGVACYVAARTVARDLGSIAGIALFAGIYGFASFGVETTLSESLGVTLGALAFAALWNAVRDRDTWLSGAGVLLLALALSARPGTVVLVLVLPVFFAFYLRRGKRINLRALALGATAIVAALGINLSVAASLDGAPSNLNGSFYPTLYGLAKGNEVWTKVYSDYPQLEKMSEPRANRFIRARAIEEIRRHPLTFVRGLARSGGDYLQQTRDTIMGPVERGSVRWALYAGAALAGALALGLRWRTSRWRVLIDLALFGALVFAAPALFGLWEPEYLPLVVVAGGYPAFVVSGTERVRPWVWNFALVSFAAIAVSIPLTTVRDAGPRVYAATVPFFALTFAGAAAILDRLVVGAHEPAPARAPRLSKTSWVPVTVGGSIIAVVLFATPVAMATVTKPEVHPRTCPDGRRPVAFTGGVAVHLVANEPRAEDELDDLDLARFSPEAIEIAGSLQGLPPRTTILQALRLGKPPYFVLAVVDGLVDAPGRTVLYLCGETRATAPAVDLPVFFGAPLGS